jgi:iron complex transport system ATP-binding protein
VKRSREIGDRGELARRPAPVVRLSGATVVRGGVPILEQVSLSIGLGEHTAIVGPNGSGKSTLLKLLTCQLYPRARRDTEPPVRIFGRDRWNVAELRSRMGVVSAELHHRLAGGSSLGRPTALDTVVASFFASEVVFLHHEVDDTMTARAEAALERAGVARVTERPVHTLSTGELRRVLIARALVHEPEVLVLDEPTTGLDLVARRDLLATLSGLARGGTTLILVTHQVEEIFPEIGRVVLLRRGRVVDDGPTGAVLTSERLSRAYGSPLSVRCHDGRYEVALGSHAAPGR